VVAHEKLQVGPSHKTGSVSRAGDRGPTGTDWADDWTKIGYVRISTDGQDLTAQRDGLNALGVPADRLYVDHGLTGTNRDRPGLRQALAACRAGDTLVVTKLDRLARSLPNARAIANELTAGQIRLSLGGSVHDPTDRVGRLLFNVLAMVAEFEADLARMRTREGMKVAKGRLRGKQPKLSPRQETHLVALYRAGEHTVSDLEELFSVTRSTVYRAVGRAGGRQGQASSSPVGPWGTRSRPSPRATPSCSSSSSAPSPPPAGKRSG